MRAVWALLQERKVIITIPTVVLVECWSNPTEAIRELVAVCAIEELTQHLAEVAARARASCGGRGSVVDAVVMASAASRGDDVYTGDFEDMERLRDSYFRGVRLLSA